MEKEIKIKFETIASYNDLSEIEKTLFDNLEKGKEIVPFQSCSY